MANNNQNRNLPLPRLGDIFLKKFSGEAHCNPYAHWLEWEDYCELYQLTPQQQIDRFKHTLTSDAREWISGKAFQTPNELKDSFIQYFSGFRSREASLEAFRNCKWIPGECIEKYASKIDRLGQRLNMGNDLIREQFLNGFPVDMKIAVIMSGAATLAEMKSKAQRYADLQKEKHVQVASHFSFTESKLDSLVREVADLKLTTKSLADNSSKYCSYQHNSRDQSRDRYQNKYRDGRSRDRYRSDSRGRRPDRSLSRGRYTNRSRDRNNDYYRGRRSDRSASRGRQVRVRDPTPASTNREAYDCWYCGQDSHGWKQCVKLAKELAAGNVKHDKDF